MQSEKEVQTDNVVEKTIVSTYLYSPKMQWKIQMYSESETKKRTKMPADNKRFGAMAGVTPQKVQCEIERKCPAWPIVNPATSPSRLPVIRQPGDSAVRNEENKIENEKNRCNGQMWVYFLIILFKWTKVSLFFSKSFLFWNFC